jgi:hypothetical protein
MKDTRFRVVMRAIYICKTEKDAESMRDAMEELCAKAGYIASLDLPGMECFLHSIVQPMEGATDLFAPGQPRKNAN